MALNIKSLALYASVPKEVADAAPVNFYKYTHSVDTAATIIAAGYFNDARDKLKVNDRIDIMAVSAGTGNYIEVTVTAAPASGNVTVAVDSDVV